VSRMHHLALTTSQMEESARFYDAVLGAIGYKRGMTSPRLCTWHDQVPEILLYEVEGQDASRHVFGRPGWHHAAFHAPSRSTVYAVHNACIDEGWTVVHEPREYPEYSSGYFAVFVEDPDGLRVEIAYIP